MQGPDTEAQDPPPPDHHFRLATRGRSIQNRYRPISDYVGNCRQRRPSKCRDTSPEHRAGAPTGAGKIRSKHASFFAPEPTPFVQCRLLGLADSLTRFQRWPLSPGVREKTRQRPFLSHGGPRNLHSARTERPTNQNEIPWSAVVELQSHRRVSRNENSISALSPKHRRNRF